MSGGIIVFEDDDIVESEHEDKEESDDEIISTAEKDKKKDELIHLTGEAIWKNKDGAWSPEYRKKYQDWKQRYLPKHKTQDFKDKVADWKETVASWVDEILLQTVEETLQQSIAQVEEKAANETPEKSVADEKHPVSMSKAEIKTLVKKLVAGIFTADEDKVAALKESLVTKLKSKKFNVKDVEQLDEIPRFIVHCLATCYSHPQVAERFFLLTDIIALPEECPDEVAASDDDFVELKEILIKIGLAELESGLRRAGSKILNADGAIFQNVSKSKLDGQCFLDKPLRSLEDDLATMFDDNRGKNWRLVLPPAIKDNLWSIKLKAFVKKFNAWLNKVIQDEEPIVFNDAMIDDLVSLNSKRKAVDLTDGERRRLVCVIKNVVYCLLNELKLDEGLFLIEEVGAQSNPIVSSSKKLFMDKLFQKRDVDLKQVVLSAGQVGDEKTADVSYVTVLPADYRFPEIADTGELLAAFKLSVRSLIRCYKLLATETFLYPNLPVKELQKIPDRNAIIPKPEFSIYGESHCHHYLLKDMAATSVRYILTTNGLVDPYSVTVGSYPNTYERLVHFKSKIPPAIQVTDQSMADWIAAVMAVDPKPIVALQLSPIVQASFLQVLVDFTICLFMVEGIRNKGSFASHVLTLQIIKNGTVQEKLLSWALTEGGFSMTPKESSALGRELHNNLVADSSTLMGTPKNKNNQTNAVRQREQVVLKYFETRTFKQVRECVYNFWQRPAKLAKQIKLNIITHTDNAIRPQKQ